MGKQFYLFFLSLFFVSCSQDILEEKFEDFGNMEMEKGEKLHYYIF